MMPLKHGLSGIQVTVYVGMCLCTVFLKRGRIRMLNANKIQQKILVKAQQAQRHQAGVIILRGIDTRKNTTESFNSYHQTKREVDQTPTQFMYVAS